MTWVLTICTAAWIMCGQHREMTYPDESSCYRAMEQIYKQHGKESFRYVTCSWKVRP